MAQSWDQTPRPGGAPAWLGACGNVSLCVISITTLVLLLPHKTISGFKPLRKYRSWVLRVLRRVLELSKQGPFYRLFVNCGRRCCCGRLASRCSAPQSLRAKTAGCNEVTISFGTNQSLNPFHEEGYFLAWCRDVADESARHWVERPLGLDADLEDMGGGRFRVMVDGLPEQAAVRFHVCSVNRWGRSAWSLEVTAETLAQPFVDGGSFGPLGPAATGDRRRYTWAQSRLEVSLRVPISASLKAKDISFKAMPSRLEIRLKGAPPASDALLVGRLPKKIKADEASWFIDDNGEDGRHLSVQMTKAEAMEKWPCLIEADGHPHIDTRMVRLFPNGLTGGMDIFE